MVQSEPMEEHYRGARTYVMCKHEPSLSAALRAQIMSLADRVRPIKVRGPVRTMGATGVPAPTPATTAVTTSTASPDGLVDIHIQIRSPRHA